MGAGRTFSERHAPLQLRHENMFLLVLFSAVFSTKQSISPNNPYLRSSIQGCQLSQSFGVFKNPYTASTQVYSSLLWGIFSYFHFFCNKCSFIEFLSSARHAFLRHFTGCMMGRLCCPLVGLRFSHLKLKLYNS